MRIQVIDKRFEFGRVLMVACLLTGVASAQQYQQTNLVSNVSGAANTDTHLVNAWGLARSSMSPWWVSDNGTDLSTLYNSAGAPQSLVVNVSSGAPTGAVFNGGPDFKLANGNPARFLFASENGTISGWNSGTSVEVVVTTPGAVYKGLATAVVDGKRQLYATDFHGGHIDVFDASFHMVTPQDQDDKADTFQFRGRLRGLAPFNVQNIGGTLFVSFAKQDEAKHDDTPGPGNGLVAAFTPAGRLIQIFEHVQDLNSPWGLTLAPGDFGAFSHHLLVGQFGSGEILAYNIVTGKMVGKMLGSGGQPVVIDGLWGLSFGSGKPATNPANPLPSGPATTLFFSAGPNGEQNGLFGTLTPVELVEGNGN